LPKQNRPLVRDGRLQAKKKRTDRSYLRPNGGSTSVIEDEVAPDTAAEDEAVATANGATLVDREEPTVAEMATEETVSAADPVSPGSPAAVPVARSTAGRLPTTVRAIQQQGVRKRREFDVHALAIRDTQYAIHEVRRIFILASAVIITLIVLGLTLR
jgi:hypothetical protein